MSSSRSLTLLVFRYFFILVSRSFFLRSLCSVMSWAVFIFGRDQICCMRQIFCLFFSRSLSLSHALSLSLSKVLWHILLKKTQIHRGKLFSTTFILWQAQQSRSFHDFHKSIGKFLNYTNNFIQKRKIKSAPLVTLQFFILFCVCLCAFFVYLWCVLRTVFRLFCRFYFHLDFSCLIGVRAF